MAVVERVIDPRADCWHCAYRRNIPGNAHVECARTFKDVPKPDLDRYGVRSGWCFWPLNFDPTWVGACQGFSAKEEPDKLRGEDDVDPLIGLLALLGRP